MRAGKRFASGSGLTRIRFDLGLSPRSYDSFDIILFTVTNVPNPPLADVRFPGAQIIGLRRANIDGHIVTPSTRGVDESRLFVTGREFAGSQSLATIVMPFIGR